MPLEPTEEQRETIADLLAEGGFGQIYPTVDAVFALIRDMVLEAAARECELPQAQDDWVPEIAQQCARDIRAMKGPS